MPDFALIAYDYLEAGPGAPAIVHEACSMTLFQDYQAESQHDRHWCTAGRPHLLVDAGSARIRADRLAAVCVQLTALTGLSTLALQGLRLTAWPEELSLLTSLRTLLVVDSPHRQQPLQHDLAALTGKHCSQNPRDCLSHHMSAAATCTYAMTRFSDLNM